MCARAGTKYCMLAVSTKEPVKKFWNWTQEHNMGNEPNNGMENHSLTKIAKYSIGTNCLAELSVTDRKTYPSSTTPQ